MCHTTVDVVQCICSVQTDLPFGLTFDVGKSQDTKKLRQKDFQAAYSSLFTRCHRLAEYLSNYNPVFYDKRIMKLNYVKWEELPGMNSVPQTRENYGSRIGLGLPVHMGNHTG